MVRLLVCVSGYVIDGHFHILFFQLRLRIGMYHIFIKDWLKIFPREQIIVIKTEDMENADKNIKVYEQLFKFLEISKWILYLLVVFNLCVQCSFKETKSATTFEKKYFLFKSFVKVELSYVFTINLFTIAENCMEKQIIL